MLDYRYDAKDNQPKRVDRRLTSQIRTTIAVILLFAVLNARWAAGHITAYGTGATAAEHSFRCQTRHPVVLLAGGIDNRLTCQNPPCCPANEYYVHLATAELFHMRSGRFTVTGSMSIGRIGHAATPLRSHNVLITGGDGEATDRPINSAELYDAASDTFIVTGSMTDARVGHTATLLPDGEVLVAGGQDRNFTTLSSAELYDPASGAFHSTGSMSVPRVGHSATLLRNGTVLIAGGGNATAEIYDPATGEFTATGPMSIPRQFHTAILLKNGEVLIAGGGTFVGNCGGCSTASAELYDPVAYKFRSTGSMTNARVGHTATRLRDGKVLITGGIDDIIANNSVTVHLLGSAEIYDPSSESFVPTGEMTDKRSSHSATLLDDGRVLIAGGFDSLNHITGTAELYIPAKGTFVKTGHMTDARTWQTATGLR